MAHELLTIVGCPHSMFAGVWLMMVLVTGIFTAFLLVLVGILAGWFPREVYAPADPTSRKKRQRCDYCGYDLRASPDYCPECGAGHDTFRKASAGVVAPRPVRSIVFRALPAGEDLLLTVPRSLRDAIGRLFRERPGDIDLLFGASGGEGEKLTSSQELLDAVSRTTALVGADPSQRDLLIPLRRLRHFARQHPYARVSRSICAQSQTGGR